MNLKTAVKLKVIISKMNKILNRFLTDDEKLRISRKISELEKFTSGEISVSVKENRSIFEKKKNIRQLAEEEFHRLGITKTKGGTGILLFILPSEREFYILADKGINVKVKQETWDSIKEEMIKFFSTGNFCGGILFAVDEVGKILAEHFPPEKENPNEISNQVSVN